MNVSLDILILSIYICSQQKVMGGGMEEAGK